MTSALAKHLPVSWADDDQLRRMRAAAWHKQGIAVLRLEDIRDDWTRQAVKNEANRLYGERQASHGAR